jgi:hypothetical protein
MKQVIFERRLKKCSVEDDAPTTRRCERARASRYNRVYKRRCKGVDEQVLWRVVRGERHIAYKVVPSSGDPRLYFPKKNNVWLGGCKVNDGRCSDFRAPPRTRRAWKGIVCVSVVKGMEL